MKIRNKISLFVIPSAVLPILLLGIFSYISLNRGFKEQSDLEDQRISLIAANQIEQVLDSCHDALQFLSFLLSKQLISSNKSDFRDIIKQKDCTFQLLANNIALRYSPNLQIRFIAPNGDELFKTDGFENAPELSSALDEAIFLQAVAKGDWRFVKTMQFPPQKHQRDGSLTTTFCHRLVKEGRLFGFIFLDINLTSFSNILEKISKTQNSYFLLFDGKNNKIASGGEKKILQSDFVMEKFNYILQEIHNKLVTTFRTTTLKEGIKGYTLCIRPIKEYIAFEEPIPAERWYLAVLRSDTPLLSAFYKTQVIFLIVLLGGITIAISGTFYISKRITTPIGKLTLTTKRFSQGKLDSTINIKSRDEIGELAADFNKMAKDLKRMMLEVDIHKNLAAIGKFAAGMYHDIKSPLEGLKLLISGMKKKIKDEDPIKKYLNEIDFGVNNLDQLIQGTMDFVKPKSLSIQSVNLNEFLKSVTSNLKLGNTSIDWKLSKNISNINLDPNQMKHVFLNLINNAKEAMPSGGKLILSTALEKYFIKIEISDSGIGIEKDHLENIFQPFFSTKKKGHGLGLSLVHQIVSNHKGRIAIESEVGMGTRVIICLPSNPQNEKEIP